MYIFEIVFFKSFIALIYETNRDFSAKSVNESQLDIFIIHYLIMIIID